MGGSELLVFLIFLLCQFLIDRERKLCLGLVQIQGDDVGFFGSTVVVQLRRRVIRMIVAIGVVTTCGGGGGDDVCSSRIGRDRSVMF